MQQIEATIYDKISKFQNEIYYPKSYLLASPVFMMERICKSNISFYTKFQLYKLLVVSILLYRCDTWTLLDETGKGIQVFDINCLRKLHIYWSTKPMTMDEAGLSCMVQQEFLFATIKIQKMSWFSHITASAKPSCKTLLKADVTRNSTKIL